jgi:hypothetical protein
MESAALKRVDEFQIEAVYENYGSFMTHFSLMLAPCRPVRRAVKLKFSSLSMEVFENHHRSQVWAIFI